MKDNNNNNKTKETSEKINRSYLKWAGSKTRLIKAISEHIPKDSKRLIEPFLGSSVVALNLAPHFKQLLLADTNADLINCHNDVIKNENFNSLLAELFTGNNNRQQYDSLRIEFNSTEASLRKSLLFVYLNRHGFNGLCRYSARGGFNTPFGSIEKPYLPIEELDHFRATLKKAKLITSDFQKVISQAKAGDFVYCDPPYVPLTNTANFTAYAAGGFSFNDQALLAKLAEEACARGATVLISNHDTSVSRKLYQNASKIKELLVARTISRDINNRKKAKELLAIYSPINAQAAK